MVTLEGIIIMPEEHVQKFWKLHNEQFKLDNSVLKGHLLLLHLNSLHRLLGF
jgi:hypothetical protein